MILKYIPPHPAPELILNATRDFIFAAGRRDEWPALEAELKRVDYDMLCDLAEAITCDTILIQVQGLEEPRK